MSETHHDALPLRELYRQWNFDPAVFRADEARKEKRLGEVIILPSWFYDVLGDVGNTDFAVVVGARGAGKSAIRRYIAERSETEVASTQSLGGDVLCVTIDHDVPYWISLALKGEDPFQVFCTELASSMALGIASRFYEQGSQVSLSSAQQLQFTRYVKRLSLRAPEEAEEILKHIQGRFKRLYEKTKASEVLQDVIDVATGSDTGHRIATGIEDSVYPHAYEDVAALLRSAQACGFDAVYVLVDEVDEYVETRNKPHVAAQLVAPIISSLQLLELEGLAFKFFLSEAVYGELEDLCNKKETEIRWDRTSHPEPYHLAWDDSDIRVMLEKRLRVYSTGDQVTTSLDSFCNQSVTESVDEMIARYAYRSPRHFIQLAERLCKNTARIATRTKSKITKETLEKSKLGFSRLITKKLYSEAYVNSLIRLGVEEFTENDFVENLGIEVDKAQAALRTLSACGALESTVEIGSIRYRVQDPRLLVLMQEGSE